jgi:PAS domain S-box-containing protein
MDSGVAGQSVLLHAGSDADAIRDAVESMDATALTVRSVTVAEDAHELLSTEPVGCVVCEAAFDGRSGLALLGTVAAEYPALPTLFVTAEDSLATDAITAGATDVFVRPEDTESAPLLGRRLANVLAQADIANAGEDRSTVDLLQQMYEVTTDTQSTYEEKLERLLKLGCETLGLANGFLTHIEADGTDGRQTIVQAHGNNDLLQAGESCPLSEAYCRRTIETDGLLAVSDAPAAGWTEDPAYDRFGLDCYIGGKVVLDEGLYGTVCFADSEPRERPFTELQRTAVRLLSAWVSYELAQRRATSELEMKNRVMDEAPVGILISDATEPDNPAVYINDEFETLTGYGASEVVGRNCRFLQGDGTRSEPVERLRTAIDAAEPVSVELRNYRKDGTEFWNRVTVAPIRDPEGDLTHYVGFQEDITERKEHELDLKLRNRAISAAPIGITIHDATAHPWPITYANSAFQQVTGHDSASAIGAGLSVLTGAETDAERFEAIERAFERGDSVSETLLLYRADGSPMWARVSIAPVTDEDGATTHFVGFVEDVTESKEYEQHIERRLDEFGDVLAAELHSPLTEALERLDGDPASLPPDDIAAAVETLERTDRLVDDLTEVHSFAVKSREVFEPDDVDLRDEP